MTAFLILAITADRKVRRVRHCRKEIQQAAVLGLLHLRLIPCGKSSPGFSIRADVHIVRECQKTLARRQVGQPNIKPVVGCVPRFRNTSRRPADCSDPDAFLGISRCTQSYDSNRHIQRSRLSRSLTRLVLSLLPTCWRTANRCGSLRWVHAAPRCWTACRQIFPKTIASSCQSAKAPFEK